MLNGSFISRGLGLLPVVKCLMDHLSVVSFMKPTTLLEGFDVAVMTSLRPCFPPTFPPVLIQCKL